MEQIFSSRISLIDSFIITMNDDMKFLTTLVCINRRDFNMLITGGNIINWQTLNDIGKPYKGEFII